MQIYRKPISKSQGYQEETVKNYYGLKKEVDLEKIKWTLLNLEEKIIKDEKYLYVWVHTVELPPIKIKMLVNPQKILQKLNAVPQLNPIVVFEKLEGIEIKKNNVTNYYFRALDINVFENVGGDSDE